MSKALEILEELRENRLLIETLDIFWAVNLWLKTGNPHFMDYVLAICDTAKIEIGPALQAELVNAATARLYGFPPGEAAQVKREMQIYDYLTLMAQLVHEGMNQTQAANEAVDTLDGPYEFSTVYRYYTEIMKKPGHQRMVFEMIDEAIEMMRELYPDK